MDFEHPNGRLAHEKLRIPPSKSNLTNMPKYVNLLCQVS